MIDELPDIQGRQISEDEPVDNRPYPQNRGAKPRKPKPVPPAPLPSVEPEPEPDKQIENLAKPNSPKDEQGKDVSDLLNADVVPALVRPTDKKADTMAFHERIAWEKEQRAKRRKSDKMSIKVSGFKTINEY